MARKKRKRKRTPEEIERERQFERQSDENLRRLWQAIERGWDDLEARAAREGRPLRVPRPERPVWADPEPR